MNKQKIIAVTAASLALLSIATFGLRSVSISQVHAQTPEISVQQHLTKNHDVNKTDSGSEIDMKESDIKSTHKRDVSDDLQEASDGNSIDREIASFK